jgi:hypothetical protein
MACTTLASFALVFADDRPAALLARASSALVLADARPTVLLACAFHTVVLADSRAAAWWPAPLWKISTDRTIEL